MLNAVTEQVPLHCQQVSKSESEQVSKWAPVCHLFESLDLLFLCFSTLSEVVLPTLFKERERIIDPW